MTDLTQDQAISKADEYLADPIGIEQSIGSPDYDLEEIKESPTTLGDIWLIKWKGRFGGKSKRIVDIHIKKDDGELLYWRNYPDPKDKKGHGATGWQKERKYWVG